MAASLAEAIRKHLGWCPMASVVQPGTGTNKTAEKPEKPDSAGPATGRAVLYSRLTWVIVGFSYLIAFAALPFLPEIIPIHWNLYGEPDGFSGKLPGAFGIPVIITLVAVALTVLPRFEHMKLALHEARDIYQVVVFSTVLLLLGIEAAVLLSAGGMDVPLGVAIPVLLGFFFILLGYMMPHVPRNTTIGFRLPWTLRDEGIWRKTHERGGTALVVAGAIIVLASPVAGTFALPLLIGVIAVTFLYITGYSYLLAKKVPGPGEE